MSIKTKVAVAGIITTTVLLFSYVSFRSGSIEGEYVKTLTAQTDHLAIAFSGFEKDRPAAGRNLNRFLAEMTRENPNMALLAVADGSNRVLAGSKNDRYIRDRASFDELTAAFSRGELAPKKNAGYAVRYLEQTKFYFYVKETPSGRLLIAFPYKLRGKLMVKLLLEIALIVILAVILTTALYLYLVRRERPAPVRAASPEAMEKPAGPEETTAADRVPAQSPVAEAVAAISTRHTGARISLYIVNPAMTGLEKHLEFTDGAHVPMDGSADSIDTTDEIGEELGHGSMLVLNRGKRLIIPIMHRGDLIGAVGASRSEAFSGPEISEFKKYADDLSRKLVTGQAS